MSQPSVDADRAAQSSVAAICARALALAELCGDADDDGPTILPEGTRRCPDCGFEVGATRICARCHFAGWWWP